MAMQKHTPLYLSSAILPPDPFPDDTWSWARVYFKLVEGWPGYAVDTDGFLWGCRKCGAGVGRMGQWRKFDYASTSSNGRIIVGLWRDGKRTSRQLHKIIMETFVGPCPPGLEICHNNGDHTDNRLRNLRYDTRRSNEADKLLHGTKLWGDRNPKSKLDEGKVREIKALLKSGEWRQCALAARFGVDDAIIARIRDGKAWTWVD